MKLHLAPMEGIVDWVVRDVLTQHGGIDRCVTEFVRVTDREVPPHVLEAYCPELKTGSRTRAGTPVYIQFLGGHAEPLAASAVRAAEMGACGIDLNFGCPAKTVNRHDGGAVLLKEPERIRKILLAVRSAVPASTPVTAKIRLGFDDPSACLEVGRAVVTTGVQALTVHCRTKMDLYKPPAYWEWIPRLREEMSRLALAQGMTAIPIIANGEVWTVEDYWRCREISGSEDVMIGRGAIADPFLFAKIKISQTRHEARSENSPPEWQQVKKIFQPFYHASREFKNESFAQARTKQWLSQVSKRTPEAKVLFDDIKAIPAPRDFYARMVQHLEA